MVITKIRPRSERGFTMAEILTVMTIVGVLAAIAIPLSLSSRSKGTEAAMTQDLNSVASSVQRLLSGWRGTPPAQIAITTTSGSWKAARGNTTDAGGPVATQGATVTGTVWTNGSYCVQASNGSTSLTYRSDTDAVTSGTCPAEELQGPGTITVAPAAGVPATPTGVLASSTVNNRVVVSWTTVAGATGYTVVVPNKAPSTTTTTTVTVDGVQPGAQTVSVRAFNSSGSGVPENVSVTVIGPQLYTNSTGNDFSGTVSARSNVNVTGAVAASSTMSVGGALTASSGLNVTGLTSLTGDLTGSGTSKLNQVFVGGGAIAGTGGYATILGTNDFPFVVRPTDASGVAQGNSELYYSSSGNYWRFEAPLSLAGNTELTIGGATVGATLGGLKIQTTTDARWPVVLRPIGIDGVSIGTAEFYYNSTDDRWHNEANFRVDKALTVVGATTVSGAAALNGGLTSTTATLSGALSGTSATLSGALSGATATFSGTLNGQGANLATLNLTTLNQTGTANINQIRVGAGSLSSADGYTKIWGTGAYPFLLTPTNSSGTQQTDSEFGYDSANDRWASEANVRLEKALTVVGDASLSGGLSGAAAAFTGNVTVRDAGASGGARFMSSSTASSIFTIRPINRDGSTGVSTCVPVERCVDYGDLTFSETDRSWKTRSLDVSVGLTGPGFSAAAGTGLTMSETVNLRTVNNEGGSRLISSSTAASVFSIRPVKTDGTVGSGANTAYNDLYFNQTANEWVTGDLEVTRNFAAPGITSTNTGNTITKSTQVTGSFYRESSWTVPTLGSNWSTYDGKFKKLPDGTVQFRGQIIRSQGYLSPGLNSAAKIMTLPSGYRPDHQMWLPVVCYYLDDNSNFVPDFVECALYLDQTGEVWIWGDPYASGWKVNYVELDGVRFLTG